MGFRRFVAIRATIEMEISRVWLLDDGEFGGDVG